MPLKAAITNFKHKFKKQIAHFQALLLFSRKYFGIITQLPGVECHRKQAKRPQKAPAVLSAKVHNY